MLTDASKCAVASVDSGFGDDDDDDEDDDAALINACPPAPANAVAASLI